MLTNIYPVKKALHGVCLLLILCASKAFSQKFTLDAVLSYPFPTELCSAAQESKIAWAFNERGVRNVYVAEGPDFKPRKLSSYTSDDGQEISSLSISADGNMLVYVRGGDHSSSEGSVPVNPAFDIAGTKVQVWTLPFAGGTPKLVSEGDYPVISPKGDQVAFIKSGQIWLAPVAGSATAKNLFAGRGNYSGIQWSPDGSQIAFVSARADHSFIGIFSFATQSVKWLAPAFSKDSSPRWSPDGTKIAFVRMPGSGGAPDSILAVKHQPWAIWTGDVATAKASRLWQAPETLRGSFPTTDGGAHLNWAAGNRIVFLSYQDGWPHLYSMPSTGGQPLLLTSGQFMVEQIKLSPDKKFLVFSANNGGAKEDLDRRHISKVPVDHAAIEMLTPGAGIETYPVFTNNGSAIAFLSSTAQRPLLPAVLNLNTKKTELLGEELIPANFPRKNLIVPKQVVFKAADGLILHGQLFEPANVKGKRPAIVYVHGGPQRQMVLGWHFMDYYSIDYALNQYLASLGFTVLSVNYRLGIGYGYEFHKPANSSTAGASEYMDIKAAGEWLAAQPEIDAARIGIYGGSYGGFLAALAMGKDSKLFAAGVDIHGVHNRDKVIEGLDKQAPDYEKAVKVAFQSSPVAYVNSWTSPVLLIHADDDRNVPFSQSVDLARRFQDKSFPFESLVIPDDTHHWMKFSNAVIVSEATADFLKRKLLK
jgi:dipeptidyl aminopeptidase/acylaminoacyl peptidase